MLRALLIICPFLFCNLSFGADDSLYSNSIQQNSMLNISYQPSEIKLAPLLSKKIDQFVFDEVQQRPFYNHCFKFSTGGSLTTLRLDKSMACYNDTSEHHFDVNGHSPAFSFGHEMMLDKVFGLGYTIGFANSRVNFDNAHFGTRHFFVSLDPQLFIVRKYNFEYYFKLRIGFSYYQNCLSKNPSEILQRIYPTGFKMFTGVTIAGINYLISDHFALNAELTLWAAQTVNIGVSYRFFNKKRERMPDFKKSAY